MNVISLASLVSPLQTIITREDQHCPWRLSKEKSLT